MKGAGDLEEAAYVVDQVVRRFSKRQAPADRADMEQEAWAAALDTLHRGKYDPAKAGPGGLRGYLYTAVNRKLGNGVSRWLSAVAMGNRVYDGHTARETQAYARVSPTGTTGKPQGPRDWLERGLVPEVLQTQADQEDAALVSQWRRRRRRWGIRFQRALARCLRGLGPAAQDLVVRRYGLDGLSADEAPATLAGRLGLTPQEGAAALTQFHQRVRRDLDMYGLMQEVKQEDG